MLLSNTAIREALDDGRLSIAPLDRCEFDATAVFWQLCQRTRICCALIGRRSVNALIATGRTRDTINASSSISVDLHKSCVCQNQAPISHHCVHQLNTSP